MSETERNCPECGTTLHAKATYCGCGWGKGKKGGARPIERRTVCAFDTCGRDAVVKVKTSNLCEIHYEFLSRKSAEDYCQGLGLKTIHQRREWAKANSRGLKRFPIKDAA